jgi:hypothetical protein
MLRGQPNNLRSAQRDYRCGGPDLVTQCHSNRPIPLLFHSVCHRLEQIDRRSRLPRERLPTRRLDSRKGAIRITGQS